MVLYNIGIDQAGCQVYRATSYQQGPLPVLLGTYK